LLSPDDIDIENRGSNVEIDIVIDMGSSFGSVEKSVEDAIV